MNNTPLLGSTVYWNMTVADYCRFHDTWQNHQPYVRTTLRPSKQEGKVVVAFHLYNIQSVALYIQACLDLQIPADEGTNIIIKHTT